MKNLQEGDIIVLKKGHVVYVDLPAHFIYSNRHGVMNETASTEIRIGEIRGGLNTSFLSGRYVVERAYLGGGGHGHGPGDEYPDGWCVQCRRIDVKDSELRVSFYQTGAFTAMITDIQPVGHAKATWSES